MGGCARSLRSSEPLRGGAAVEPAQFGVPIDVSADGGPDADAFGRSPAPVGRSDLRRPRLCAVYICRHDAPADDAHAPRARVARGVDDAADVAMVAAADRRRAGSRLRLAARREADDW